MAERSFHHWIFALAVPLTLWLTWAAWRGPPPQAATTTPPPHFRSASPLEVAAVHETAQFLTSHIQSAQKAHQRDIQVWELEGKDERGEPFIPIPIHDNTLVAGVASVQQACEKDPVSADKDWVYCPSTGILTAVIPDYSVVNGNP